MWHITTDAMSEDILCDLGTQKHCFADPSSAIYCCFGTNSLGSVLLDLVLFDKHHSKFKINLNGCLKTCKCKYEKTDSMWQVSFRNEKYLLKNILCTRVTFLIVYKRHLSGSDFVFSFSLTGISFCIDPKRQIALATEFLCWTFVLVWTGLNTTLQCNLMF